MNKANFELVKKSWATISTIDYEIVCGSFYIRLFQIAPELRHMFSNTSLPVQSVKLGCMLAYVIAKYESMDDVLQEVKALAERHKKYGVTSQHLWCKARSLQACWQHVIVDT